MRTETIGDATLYLGDMLEIVPTLESQSVDAILTDIPYGTTACSWDEIIPFDALWRVVKHVLKPRGVFVTTASQPFTSALVMSNPGWFKYEWIWNKKKPGIFIIAKYQPLRITENIVVFSEGTTIYNPIMTEAKEENKRPRNGKYKKGNNTTIGSGISAHKPNRLRHIYAIFTSRPSRHTIIHV
jgi:site-specific DNA-methyltransferase (adenine-specific)